MVVCLFAKLTALQQQLRLRVLDTASRESYNHLQRSVKSIPAGQV
jgi:hypothetical protein